MKYKERRVETLLAAGGAIAIAFLVCWIVVIAGRPKAPAVVTPGDFSVAIAAAFAIRLLGGLVALAGALSLALNAVMGAPLERLTRWIVVALAGAALLDGGWGAAVGLGGIGVALIVRNLLAPEAPTASPSPRPAEEDAPDDDFPTAAVTPMP